MRSSLAIVIALVCTAPMAVAHPFPDLSCQREVTVRVSASGFVVRYQTEFSGLMMVIDGKQFLTNSDTVNVRSIRSDYTPLYAKKKAIFIADGFIARIGDMVLPVQHLATQIEYESDSHIIIRYELRADWPKDVGREFTLVIEDTNFDADPTRLKLQFLADLGTSVTPLETPRVVLESNTVASAKIVLNTEPKPAPIQASIEVEPTREVHQGVLEQSLTHLLDSETGLVGLLLMAFIFGAGHAFTPGHGKTMVAAYLVGERGTTRHAVVLGIVTTLTHTGAVIALAAILAWRYHDGVPQAVQGWLQIAGGVLVFFVAVWLLAMRLLGKADHVHFGPHGHHHHHAHDAAKPDPPQLPKTRLPWVRVVLLGIAGGLVPCWDAVLLLCFAISAGRLSIAVPMLVAFSAGLAAVLVGLGVMVVLAQRFGRAKFEERRWFRWLPVVSAAVLMVLGIVVARAGVQQLALPVPATPLGSP